MPAKRRRRSDPRALLAVYRHMVRFMLDVAAGLPEEQLDAPTEDGEDGVWTLRAHIHHLADVSVMGALRLRLMLAGVTLEYWQYDQAEFQQANRYEREVVSSLALIEAIAASNAAILDHLPDEEWTIPHKLPDGSEFTVIDWVRNALKHLQEHAELIERATGQ